MVPLKGWADDILDGPGKGESLVPGVRGLDAVGVSFVGDGPRGTPGSASCFIWYKTPVNIK